MGPDAHRSDVLELTRQLIAIESHRLCDGREAEIARFLVDWFTERGIQAQLQPAVDGRSNVIARIPGGDGPSLMLCGHMDTVPSGDMADAFSPRVDGDLLWGRGACDMKGAIAAMCVAMATLHCDKALTRSSAPQGHLGSSRLSGDLVFVGTVDEETGGLGVKAVVDGGIRTDYAVVGEPTNLRVALAHKGACFARVTLRGRGAHGSCPEEGVSAVSYAAKIVSALEEELRPRLVRRTHPLLGSSTVSVGRVCGGTQPNIVAEGCEIDIDRRMVPGDNDPLAELRSIVESVCGGVEGLAFDVVEMPMTSAVPHTPLETSGNSPLAEAALAASALAADGSEESPAAIGVTYWTDGSHLADHGIQTIVLGPGDIANAHGPRDHVEIAQLERAVDVYRGIALRLLGNAR
ncbi:MAG: M20 family metallopeptidase [Candidatus Bipolaricaulia bacterium]